MVIPNCTASGSLSTAWLTKILSIPWITQSCSTLSITDKLCMTVFQHWWYIFRGNLNLSTPSLYIYHLPPPLLRLLLFRVSTTAWRSPCTISPSPPCPSSSTASSTKTYLRTCSWNSRTCTKIMPTMRRSPCPGFSSGHFLVCCCSLGFFVLCLFPVSLPVASFEWLFSKRNPKNVLIFEMSKSFIFLSLTHHASPICF